MNFFFSVVIKQKYQKFSALDIRESRGKEMCSFL